MLQTVPLLDLTEDTTSALERVTSYTLPICYAIWYRTVLDFNEKLHYVFLTYD